MAIAEGKGNTVHMCNNTSIKSEQLAITYQTTMMHMNRIGFREGTCGATKRSKEGSLAMQFNNTVIKIKCL